MADTKPLYDVDFVAWLEEQSQLLKQRQWHQLDVGNLIEEIDSLARSEKRAIVSFLIDLLSSLLERKVQLEKQSCSWEQSISSTATDLQLLLEDSPSLKPYLYESWGTAYQYARKKAAIETGLPINAFPDQCSAALKAEAETLIFDP